MNLPAANKAIAGIGADGSLFSFSPNHQLYFINLTLAPGYPKICCNNENSFKVW